MSVSRSRWSTVACAYCALIFGGPSHAAAQAPAAEQTEFFERRIRPLLVEHCYRCHGKDAKRVRGELLLDTRAGLLNGGASGPAFVPGQPEKSLLIQAVRHTGELRMPPDAKLTPEQIADLTAWIKMGAPDPRSETTVAAKTPGIDINEAKKEWSFQPVGNPTPPAVKNAAWVAAPIDRFILAKLEEKGLRPAPPAEPHVLIRRLYFDLIGLPPTPEEVDEFLKDCGKGHQGPSASRASAPRSKPSVLSTEYSALVPDAVWQKWIDRLLASPHYGERWGRHWLDVVRYADSAGDNSDYPIPQMYRYRNWVIDAFNRDRPYDEFIRLQIAGDLLQHVPVRSGERGGGQHSPRPAGERGGGEGQGHDNIIATGYLANSRRHGSYEDKRYPWHLTIEDTLDNLGKTFLGATLGCARCHDHKFDPFTAEDYYALYGFFSSTRYPWPGIELDRVQRDLVPLASKSEVEAATRMRNKQVDEKEGVVKRLEADKKSLEKTLRDTESRKSDDASKKRGDELRQRVAEATKALAEAKRERDRIAKAPLPYETAYAVIDGANEPNKRIGQVGNVRLHMKGDPERPGKEVARRFPTVLGGQTLPKDVKGSGRLHLANWIADPANPRTARVMVNRIWQYHFGRGIVATPNDFGKQGQPPTHPELLDYLARRFVDSRWSVKAMHRMILMSAAYRQASVVSSPWSVVSGEGSGASGQESGDSDSGGDSPGARRGSPDPAAGAEAIDPDNAYLWHFSRRRLDAEAIRDAMLALGGRLDRSPGTGHPFPPMSAWDFTQHKPFKAVYETNRRSVYVMTQRIQRHPFLALFDGPDTNSSTANRPVSTTALQALYLMNDPFVHEQARGFAARLLAEANDDPSRIDRAYRLALGRPPSEQEAREAANYLGQLRARLSGTNLADADRGARAWESFARALFMSSEFVYLN